MSENNFNSFFSDASMETHAKVGIYGGAGTGKTRTAYEIAIGIIKESKLTKPVVFFDTEKGSDWILPLFKEAGIQCLVKKSRTFKDLMEAITLAEKNASVMIIDSISHVWRELTDSYLAQFNQDRFNALVRKSGEENARKWFKKSNQLQFEHWNVIKPTWGKFTEKYLRSELHVIVCGRSGDTYEYQEAENGKKELIKSGTKMATEKELAYEPSLLIEMQRRIFDGKERLVAVIEKDRSDKINGQEFPLPTYKDFKPHFDFINIGGVNKQVDFHENPSSTLFENQTLGDDNEFAAEKKKREIYCEEIKGLLELKIPGVTAEAKKQKNELINQVFETLSWTKVESMNSDKLKQGLDTMREKLKDL